MKIVLSHPTGNEFVRAIIEAFEKASMLAGFFTTMAVDPKELWLRLLPLKLREEVLRRTYTIKSELIAKHPVREVTRMILNKTNFKSLVQHEHKVASVDAVYQSLDKYVAKNLEKQVKNNKISAVYAYEDAALRTFIRAKELGLKCFYDLPIAYWETARQLMTVEAERLPGWACTLGGGILDSIEKIERKTRELQLADVVIGPGEFVISSLPVWASEKQTLTAHFGSPEAKNTKDKLKENKQSKPLRVIFVGSMSQRKGLADLFDAMRILNRSDVELVVMGSLMAPMEFYRKQYADFTYEAGRPHDQVLTLMHSCDVFCLPSIVEGRALVMQEAMSQSLPIIITQNTGGSDLIHEGQTGFLVPIRSPEIIAEKLAWFAENRTAIPEMGRMAKEHAAEYTWRNYGDNIVSTLSKLF